MTTRSSTQFTLDVASDGPAKGMTFAGRQRIAAPQAGNRDSPLIVAVHGGGYSSAYFDVPQYSLLDRAVSLGIPVIAIDRPGYGGTDPTSVPSGGSVLEVNAAVLDHVIGELWAEHGAGKTGVFLIGHSIGAAISLRISARAPAWPLIGISVSGCLLREPPGMGEMWASIPTPTLTSPNEDKAALMFGPEWTYQPDAPDSAYFANEPVLVSELVEISARWEDEYRSLASQITVPVHIRQGQFDRLWITDNDQVAQFASALTGSPAVDAEIFTSAGHAIDYHRGGGAFQLQQLAFALTACARLIKK